MSYKDVSESNPRIIRIYSEGFRISSERQLEVDNFNAYLQGIYFRDALLSTVGNMFKKKGAKPYEYPEKPYEFEQKNKIASEEEIELQRQLFLANLQLMQANFELSHKDTEGS